jgi:hypothetical protein
MFNSSKYGKCVERFDLAFNAKAFGLLIGSLVAAACGLIGDGRLGPYSSIVFSLALVGVLIFAVAPNCPGSAGLRAFNNGLVYQAGFFWLLFLPWKQIRGFRTKEQESGNCLVILVDETAGVGQEVDFPLPFLAPVDTVADRLMEIWKSRVDEFSGSGTPTARSIRRATTTAE